MIHLQKQELFCIPALKPMQRRLGSYCLHGQIFIFPLSSLQTGFISSSFLIRMLCWTWYELNPKTGLFRPSQTFTFGRGLKTVRVISKWALHLSGNRKLNLFNGIYFLEHCYFHFIFCLLSQSVSHLTSIY